MGVLDEVWTAIRTSTVEDAESDSRAALSVEAVQLNFRHSGGGNDFAKGGGNVFHNDAASTALDSQELNNSSVRLATLGSDDWMPQDVFVWGRDDKGIVPLAWASESTQWLSTAPDHRNGTAHVLLPLPLVAAGDPLVTVINRVLVVARTSGAVDAETAGRVRLTITRLPDVVVVDADLKGFTRARGTFVILPVQQPFKKDGFGATPVQLTARSNDAWLPTEFYVFGLDSTAGRPTAVVPLVHVPSWTSGWLSTDPGDGGGTAHPTVSLDFV